jgi:hypothetical protein
MSSAAAARAANDDNPAALASRQTNRVVMLGDAMNGPFSDPRADRRWG